MENKFNIDKLIEYFKEESTYETLEELDLVFIETTAHQQAESIKIPILYLLGNKGTGKSSVLKKLAHDHAPDYLYFYFEKFNSMIHEKISSKRSGDRAIEHQTYTEYAREWETIIWIQIARHLYFKYRQKKKFHLFDQGEYLLLFEFLDKNNLPVPLNLTSKVVRLVRRIKNVEIKNVKIEIAEEEYYSISSKIQHIESIKDAVAKILLTNPIYLIIDEVDHIPALDQETKSSILGLIVALLAVIGDINSNNYGVMIRVAMRKDMMDVVTKNYVNSEKLRQEEIDPSWNNEQLEELVARRIREHWELPQGRISRQKLLMEIWPTQIRKNRPPFEYFGWLSRENPRALIILINLMLRQSVNRKKSFIPNDDYLPVAITIDDIRNVLLEYSRKQLENHYDATNFLYPGLRQIVNGLKSKCRELFFGGIPFDDLVKSLEELLNSEENLKRTIEDWTHRETSPENRIIQVLYDSRFIGCKKGYQTTYSPKHLNATQNIIFHPVFQWHLFNTEPKLINYNCSEDFEETKALIIQLADQFLKIDLQALRAYQGSEEVRQEQSEYREKNIAYAFIKCVWSIRRLMKIIISSGVDLGLSSTRSQVLLDELGMIINELAKLTNSSVNDLHLASILLNSSKTNFVSERLTFYKEMESTENREIYNQCTKGLLDWINLAISHNIEQESLVKQLENNTFNREEIINQLDIDGTNKKLLVKELEKNSSEHNRLIKQLEKIDALQGQLIEPMEKVLNKLIAICRLSESEDTNA